MISKDSVKALWLDTCWVPQRTLICLRLYLKTQCLVTLPAPPYPILLFFPASQSSPQSMWHCPLAALETELGKKISQLLKANSQLCPERSLGSQIPKQGLRASWLSSWFSLPHDLGWLTPLLFLSTTGPVDTGGSLRQGQASSICLSHV